MARGPTLMGVLRAMERAQRQAVRAAEKAQREQDRQEKTRAREYARRAKEAEKEAKLAYLEGREGEVQDLNDDLQEKVSILQASLFGREPNGPIDLNALQKEYRPEQFNPEQAIGARPCEPRAEDFTTKVPPLGVFARLFGGAKKHELLTHAAASRDAAALEKARAEHANAVASWNERASAERKRFDEREARERAQIEAHNAEVEQLRTSVAAGEPDATAEYFSMVLDGADLPDGIPEQYRLAYVPESRQLVVERRVPASEIVPPVREYSYVRTKDEIREKARSKKEQRELYELVVANTVLSCIADVFSSDFAGTVDTLVVNGVADTISPATGKRVHACLVSVRITREQFQRLVLDRVEPVACLAGLGSVSKRMDELAPVRPVLEFEMVDRRFVEQGDVLSGLDARPNIMDLNPYEFEHLVTNLFSAMGLEAKLTRSSRDGGVDCVAFDPRPVLGGKVVVQAKRYRRTVGVAAVRDLYGTMINEGASKGILVTTAGYGPDAFAFAKDKPIELIDGGGLLYLLGEQGVEAKIIMPEE